MIRIIIKITLGFLLLISSFIVKAQTFQGKAIYQTKMQMSADFKKRMDTTKIPDERKAFIMQMIKKRMERVYELDFNAKASIYKEEKSLVAPSENERFNRSSNDVLFTDIKNKTFVNKKETFGKVFLIKDSLSTYDWKLEKETKMIGKYLCLKATTEKVVKNRMSRFRSSSKKEKTDSTTVKTPKKTKITAWYTPEIPVASGPKDFYGLPGLILQVDAGNMQYLCTKIVLNPKDKIEITASKKGKEISQEAYNKIVAKKVKEMREMYKNKRKKGDGTFGRHRH